MQKGIEYLFRKERVKAAVFRISRISYSTDPDPRIRKLTLLICMYTVLTLRIQTLPISQRLLKRTIF
jgi:hypothetical protein